MNSEENSLKRELINYWSDRSNSYGKQHYDELLGPTKLNWQNMIIDKLKKAKKPVRKILDIGTGPGFLSILLAEKGYEVTSIDMTEDMLTQAKKNAGDLSKSISWHLMDALDLSFSDETFDAIVTRNVTWNLGAPELAYKEWLRVLAEGGILLNFDSNWYHYLYDEKVREIYEKNREDTKREKIKDYIRPTNTDWMEKLAKKMPLSNISRPQWDKKELETNNMSTINIYENLNGQLFDEVQQKNFEFSPIFLIEAHK